MNATAREKPRLATSWRGALNLNRLDGGLLFEKQLVGVSEASKKSNRIGRLKWQFAQSLAGKVENIDFGFEFADVGNKDLLAGDRPVLDHRVVFGHYIHELRFLILPRTDFYDTEVGRVPIGNCQDLSVKQQRSEIVLGTPDDRLWVADAVH